MGSIVLEAFQFAALGTNYEDISEMFYVFGEFLSGGLDHIMTFSQGVYWLCLDAVLGVCGLWLLLLIYLFLHLDEKLKDVVCVGNLGWIAWLLLPHIGSLGFIPLVSVLLDVFLCDQAVGIDPDSLTYADSVLSRDCHVQCWQGSHIYYLVGASVALLLYASLAVLFKPIWQDYQSELHIKTSSSLSLVKTTFKVLLVSLSKSLKRQDSLIHGVLYLALVSIFFLFTLKKGLFNYTRVALWHRLSLVGLFWLSLLGLLSHRVSSSYWLLATLLGWSAIVVFGVIYMKLRCPSMLMRPKGVDIKQLFRFGFQFGSNHETHMYVSELNSRYKTVGIEQIKLVISTSQ
jgi:hypothetical protein